MSNKTTISKEKTPQFKFSQIGLQVGFYTNIFSDFDPRPYSQRALSDDFLSEIKRASVDKPEGGAEITFLIDKKKRDSLIENTIKKRLKAHFKHHLELTKKEKDKTILHGLFFSMAGVIFMFTATILLFRYEHTSLMITFLIVLLEPAGWFSFWEGMNNIVFESKRENPKLSFYRKMSQSSINFVSR